MPTNIADTAQIAGIESHDREQLVKAVRTVAVIDRSWLTILLLGIARKENGADGERNSANVDSQRVSKERCCCKDYFRPANVGPCVHQ